MNLLSFVARPFYLESPTSVIIRTAKRNGYQNVCDMCRTLGVSISPGARDLRLRDEPLLDHLCSEAPCLTDDLREIFYLLPPQQCMRGCNIKVHNHDVSTRSLRGKFFSCPVCLKLGYTRDPQDFVFFDFCPAHNVLLTRFCPNCGRINEWKKICGFTCDCGFNLAEAEILPYVHKHQMVIPSSFGVLDAGRLINNYFLNEAKKTKLAEPYNIEIAPLELFYAQIQNAIQADFSTYRQLPISVFQSIWTTIEEPNLRQYAIDYLIKNNSPPALCEKENCCSAITLSFRQLKYAFDAGTLRTRALIAEMAIHSEHLPGQNSITYSDQNLCLVVQAALDPGRWHFIPHHPKDHSNLRDAAASLNTTTTSMAAAVKRGFFPNTIIDDRVYCIPNKSIEEFRSQFVFYSEISDLVKIPRRTLNRLSNHLRLIQAYDRHIKEPAIYLRSSVNLARIKKTLKNFTLKKSGRSPIIQEQKIIAEQFGINLTVLYHILKTYCECNTPSKEFSPLHRSNLQRWLALNITMK